MIDTSLTAGGGGSFDTTNGDTSSTSDDDAEDNPLGADHTLGTGNSVIEDPTQPIEDLAETTDSDDDANDGSFADPETYFAGGSDADGDGENETTVGGNEVVDSNDPYEFVNGEADGDQQETDATPSDPTGDGNDSESYDPADNTTNDPTNETTSETAEQGGSSGQTVVLPSALGGQSVGREQLMLGAVGAAVLGFGVFGGGS